MAKKTRVKDFGSPAEEEETEELEPVFFKLYGKEYECLPEISGMTTLELTNKLTDGETAVQGILDFFDEVLVDGDKEDFMALAKDPKKKIKIELLTDIVGYVLEEYSDRDPKE